MTLDAAIERLDDLHPGTTPVEDGAPHERPHKPLPLAALDLIKEGNASPDRIPWRQALRDRFTARFLPARKHKAPNTPENPSDFSFSDFHLSAFTPHIPSSPKRSGFPSRTRWAGLEAQETQRMNLSPPRSRPLSSREGRIVLGHFNSMGDPENGGRFTVKKYHSAKTVSEESWQHGHIKLLPLHSNYDLIPVAHHEGPELVVLGEWVAGFRGFHRLNLETERKGHFRHSATPQRTGFPLGNGGVELGGVKGR